MEIERRAGSEFRQNIMEYISLMTRAPAMPPHPPLGPMPPSANSYCLADHIRAQGERRAALHNQVTVCHELIMDFKSQVEGLQGGEGVLKGPETMILQLMGPMIVYILQRSVARPKWLVMLLIHILMCMQCPIPMCM